MNPSEIAERLDTNSAVCQGLLARVPAPQARWKPSPDKWSLLEVINHLADEERDDFRRRLDLILHRPGELWPSIDPVTWARERSYNARELEASLRDFVQERERSVSWLRALESFDPALVHMHPVLGPITAGTLLHSWLAHHLIHIRQMTRLHYEYLASVVGAETLEYAGPW